MRFRTPSFFWIGVVAAYDALGYTLVAPILPALRSRAHASALAASLIFAGFSIGMFAGFVIAGLAISRRGPRGAALAGVLLHGAADLLFVLGRSPDVYMAARIAQGIGSGMVWMAAVFAVLVQWPERPERYLGRILTGYAVGSVAGPLVAALGGPVRPFVADAALSVFGVSAAVFFPSSAPRVFGWRFGALRSRSLAFSASMVMLVALVISALEGSYTFHFATKLSQVGLALLFTSSTIAYGLGALLPAASRGLRQSKFTAQLGAVCSALLLVSLTEMSAVAWWFVLAIFLGAAVGATEASVISIASGAAEGGLITALIIYSQAFALGFLAGPPAATWLTTQFGLVASALAVGSALLLISGSGFLVPVGLSSRPRG